MASEFPCSNFYWLVCSRCSRETNHLTIHASRRHRVLAHHVPSPCSSQRRSCWCRGVAWPFSNRRSIDRTCAASSRPRCTVTFRGNAPGRSHRCIAAPAVVTRERATSTLDPYWTIKAQEFYSSNLETRLAELLAIPTPPPSSYGDARSDRRSLARSTLARHDPDDHRCRASALSRCVRRVRTNGARSRPPHALGEFS
ncbi:unannotated protein [freshwater metagenome]|uniref:Unannotated protein n=1 Tax=freshwater metagenome TaxID=449393 RepID=A0A6J6AS66_9ZZZZ